MNNDRNEQSKTQTEEQSTGKLASNPFTDNDPVGQDTQPAREETDKEQQFKEALTERD